MTTTDKIEGFGVSLARSSTDPICDRVEELRQILARQEQREVGYSEAQEIGTSLVEFYQLLAEEVCDEPEN